MRPLLIAATLILVWLAATLSPCSAEDPPEEEFGIQSDFSPLFSAYACGDSWLGVRMQSCRGQTTGPVPVID
jgi:hypothetical protein